jgi:hypothetical protein
VGAELTSAPTDEELSRLAYKVTGLVNNGPFLANVPDLEKESVCRHRLKAALTEAADLAFALCACRGRP